MATKKKFIPVARPYIDSLDKKGVLEVLNSRALSLGPKYKIFEKNIASYCGATYASTVCNGTAGLHLTVCALGLKKGDEVITSPFSFISSSNCLLFEGVKPVFVDIEDVTYNMDPSKIEKAITKRTKAILVVHIFGQTADMAEIMRIAKKHRLSVIEDACESLGARFKGKMAGTIGDVGVYAFYPNKQMTTGEGGIVVTNKRKIHMLRQSMRNQGRNTHGDWLIHERLGYNYRMDEMSASLGVTQLRKLNWMIKKRRKIAEWYKNELANIPQIVTPKIGKQRTHSWFVYVIRVLRGNRNAIIKKLAKKHIQTKPYLPVIHLQKFMRDMFGYKKGNFPVAENITSQTIALPFYVELKKSDVIFICKTLKEILA